MINNKNLFFAGGGTGGHIYPAVAVAERILQFEPTAKIHFFCSNRSIDSRILEQTGLKYTKLPAKGLFIRPDRLITFCLSFFKSYRIAKKVIKTNTNSIVVGIGGYIAAPTCYAAHKLKVPVKLLNVDSKPGLANKIIAQWIDEIFLQFEETKKYLAKHNFKINVVGCPLRKGFEEPEPDRVIAQLGLDKNKKTLLITGASSGSENINNAVCTLLERLERYADDWQIVHLTGQANYDKVKNNYCNSKIKHTVLGYFDDMPNLLTAVDLVVGRSGAVSVAEYAAASVPSICIPYPYHRDKHQYLNAANLVDAGAAVIVEDKPENNKLAEGLWAKLQELMKNHRKRQQMSNACKTIAILDAASKIAEKLLGIDKT